MTQTEIIEELISLFYQVVTILEHHGSATAAAGGAPVGALRARLDALSAALKEAKEAESAPKKK